jgi:hypothetical protein
MAGIRHINSPTVMDETQMPFGGTQSRGIGCLGGPAGVAEFTDLRRVSISTPARHHPIRGAGALTRDGRRRAPDPGRAPPQAVRPQGLP